jgi:hypothetical protein
MSVGKSPADIERICDESLLMPGGAGVIRLIRNGVVIHELDHDQLCAAIVGLSRVLLRPGLGAYIDMDHFNLWAWGGQLLLGGMQLVFSIDEAYIQILFETVIHASLAHLRPVKLDQQHGVAREVRSVHPHHVEGLVNHSHVVLGYLVFPLLEALLKGGCSAFVSRDGIEKIA